MSHFLVKFSVSKNTLINLQKNMTTFECPSGTKCEKTQIYAQKYNIVSPSKTPNYLTSDADPVCEYLVEKLAYRGLY